MTRASAAAAVSAEERLDFGRRLREARLGFPVRGSKDEGWESCLARLGLNSATAWRYMKLAERVDAGCGPASVSRIAARPRRAIAGVYFIQGIDGGPIKIGESIDVLSRAREIQMCSPVKLQLLGALEQPSYAARQTAERAWHLAFAQHRLHGEWFSPDPSLLSEISKHITWRPA